MPAFINVPESDVKICRGINTFTEYVVKQIKNSKIPLKANFLYPGGIKDYFKENFPNRKKIISKDFNTEIKLDKNQKCEVYISFNQEEIKSLKSYCNTIYTTDGGSHENALKNSVLKALKEFGKKNQLNKISYISNNDFFDFADCIISIFINSPNF